jgi:hypothetical protein
VVKDKAVKFLTSFYSLIDTFKTRLLKNYNDQDKITHQHLHSDKLEKKLALLIKDIDSVDREDLKKVEYKKLNQEKKNDLFSSYRLDFHTRDELDHFKNKYRPLLL